MRAEVVTVNFTPQTPKKRDLPDIPQIKGMSAKQREDLLKILVTNGPQTIEGMARKATATIGGKSYNLYLPVSKTYTKTNTAKSDQSFSNTATMLYIDYDGNGKLDEWERRSTNLPLRFGQKMYDVTALSADGRSMTLTESRAPLAQLLVGEPAPPLVFKATNGKFIDLAALRGKAVVLDVWSFT